MNVTHLGTGCPPPNPRRRGPATLVAHGGERLLVDAGSGVAARLLQAARAGARTLVLTHLMPGSDPADLARRAARDFAGRILVGEDLLAL